jgi:hypothetical protein
MTELDLDALERDVLHDGGMMRAEQLALIAELQACRAERDRQRRATKVALAGIRIEEDRAERAEAEMVNMGRDHSIRLRVRDEEEAKLAARAERAEARIAAALAELPDHPWHAQRALTGGDQ